jgi:hypothetical protein
MSASAALDLIAFDCMMQVDHPNQRHADINAALKADLQI